jgi:hypothetical protein
MKERRRSQISDDSSRTREDNHTSALLRTIYIESVYELYFIGFAQQSSALAGQVREGEIRSFQT